MKSLLKSMMARTPYRLVRGQRENRFQAIEGTLESLKERGFAPRFIIDGGANVGAFSKTMLAMFPDASVHAFEPQPGCAVPLAALAQTANGRLAVHPVALGSPENEGSTLSLAATPDSISTGAHVVSGGDIAQDGTIDIRCATIDREMAEPLAGGGEIFVKLDLQGYELEALRGAERTLAATQIVLIEVSFFRQAYEPPIEHLVAFLAERGFELHDIASLSARSRDNRAMQGDFVFARRDGAMTADTRWG